MGNVRLTLCERSALAVLRDLRKRRGGVWDAVRCDLRDPSCGTARWSHALVAKQLEGLGAPVSCSPERPLHVAVTRPGARLQVRGVTSHVRSRPLPEGACIQLGNGLAASGPELVFLEMSQAMDPVTHLLLGMELTGCFSRDAADPRSGEVTYRLAPITSVERLRAFASMARGIRGRRQALQTITLIEEHAWSPMEAVLAALVTLTFAQLGYDLGPVALNRRMPTPATGPALSDASSRVPDLLFRGTKVGFNYDGDDHFGLRALVEAGIRLGSNPGDGRAEAEVSKTLAEVRRRIVEDKRRDRDRDHAGYHVMPITREDLTEPGRLDAIMLAAVDLLEHTEGRHLPRQRALLGQEVLSRQRHLLMRSLMPGRQAEEARRQLAAGPTQAELRFAVTIWDEFGVAFPAFDHDEL